LDRTCGPETRGDSRYVWWLDSSLASQGSLERCNRSRWSLNTDSSFYQGNHARKRSQNPHAGRSLSIWQAEIQVAGTEGVAAIATVVLSKRRESHSFTDMLMPSVAAPETLTEFQPPGKWGQFNTYRPSRGSPPFNQPDTRSLVWLRDRSGRPLDALHLAYHSDNFPPRTWYVRPEPEPYSTITMSVYFHATEQDCAAAGHDYILIDAFGTRAESSTVGARANVWSRGGVLLATTEQMGWFR
jgi:acyl-CoA thioesterase